MALMTLDEIAKKYKVTKATIYNWRKRGLPILKIGKTARYDEEDVDRWVKNQQGGQSAQGGGYIES